jgi:putative lipoic acid-binding regulatory protein
VVHYWHPKLHPLYKNVLSTAFDYTQKPLALWDEPRRQSLSLPSFTHLLFTLISVNTLKPPSADIASTEPSLIEYPSQFPIKVMGTKVEGYVHAVTAIAHAFDPAFDASTIELRESKGGKYLGVTITVTATSREQLDELYRTLSSHPMVKVVL